MTRNTADYQRADSAHYIHPFTDSKALGTGARIIQRAEGVYLWDSDGNKILDGMSGLWCVNIGYGRRELAEAAAKQMAELPYYNSFFQCATPPAIELAESLAQIAPSGFNRVFFTGSGSEANDTVIRMVAAILGTARGVQAHGYHIAPQRLSRQHNGGGFVGRHGGHARARRSAHTGHRPHPAAVLVWRRAYTHAG